MDIDNKSKRSIKIEKIPPSFESDPDFCPECGAIFAIDQVTVKASCVSCGHQTSLQPLIGVQNRYTIDFTPLGYYSNLKRERKLKANATDCEAAGQMDNDRECSKCGQKGMSYTTMQLRSADEGQTVFYYCNKCKHREVENS